MFSQCDISSSIIVNIDSLQCCYKLAELKESISHSDTTKYMYLYYQLICEETANPEKYHQLIDSFFNIDKKLNYSSFQSDNFKFKRNNRKAILLAKRRILEVGYIKSLDNEDFLKASDYANKLTQCFPYWGNHKIKNSWKYRELSNFEKYAANNVVKLIDYHSHWLFRDITQSTKRNPPFSGYDHLIKIISSQYGKEEFKNVLDESLAKSRLSKKNHRGRPKYNLEFEIENTLFELYDDEISILYYQDTILIDTTTTWNCFGENASIEAIIRIESDTIKQKISNPNDLENYKARFRRTFLYSIIDKLKN